MRLFRCQACHPILPSRDICMYSSCIFMAETPPKYCPINQHFEPIWREMQ